jgi:hypothetical protein
MKHATETVVRERQLGGGHWLAQVSGTDKVNAVVHGGAGAVYVLLRQLRKGRGKIIWDELLLDVDG